MKQLLQAFRGAGKTELLVMVAMVCILAVLTMGNGGDAQNAAEPEEIRLERILSQIEGAGRVTVMLGSNSEGKQGCVVAAAGAGDIRVMLELQRSVCALTGLELDQVEIVKSKR